MAATQRISGVANQTGALRRVINDTAFGIRGAHTRTWIFAFIVQASTMAGTVAVCDTFRTTTTVRISEVIGQTCACTGTVSFGAHGIRAARRRMAWLGRFITGRRNWWVVFQNWRHCHFMEDIRWLCNGGDEFGLTKTHYEFSDFNFFFLFWFFRISKEVLCFEWVKND